MSAELSLPVSIGEALDKLTILDIKCSKITDDRLAACRKEYEVLLKPLQTYVERFSWHYKILKEINLTLWELQDGFHGKDVTEIEAGRICSKILEENDRRYRMKMKINHLCSSSLREVKGYAKRRCFVFGHLGLGDIFWLVGAVRYLATCYDEVTVVCKKRNIANTRKLYEDDPSIKFFLVDEAEDISPFQDAFAPQIEAQGVKVYACGFHGKNPSIYEFPYSFYDDLKIPRSYRTEYFYLADSPESDLLYKLVTSISPEYILIHQQSSCDTIPIWEHVKKRTNLPILDLNTNHYAKDHPFFAIAEIVAKQPMCAYKKLIEGAKEIHVIESSFYCLASHLDLSKVKTKVCYKSFDKNNERVGVFATGTLD